MSRIGQLALGGAAVAAAIGLTASPSLAATTTIHSGSATGPAYSGSVTGALLGTASVSTSLGSGTCTSSTLTGTIASNGTGLNVSAASFTGTGSGGACAGSGISATVTANVPWNGGSAVYAPVAGGQDATITLANVKVTAKVKVLGITQTCIYSSAALATAGYNPNNPARPDTSVAQAQAKIAGASISKASGSGALCPSTATLTANYQLTGSGGVSLWVTS